MKKIFETWRLWLIGELLHLANSHPPLLAKNNFYRLKDALLRKYGTSDGFDVQHIVKPCYACEGGKVTEELRNCGVVVSTTRSCRRCNGKGVYEQFWTHLLRYTVGRRRFHLPERRYYEDPRLVLERPVIVGYVEHKRYPYYLSTEAFLLLALLFDTRMFFENFGRWGMPSWKVTPLVVLSDLVWRVKHFRLTIDKLFWRVRLMLITFRQDHCRHDFPSQGFTFDECKKCGISRWVVEAQLEHDEIPF